MTATMASRFDAISIGGPARRALANDAEGRVLAVFRRSLYVEMEDGRVACVGGPGLGDGPLNLRAALPDGFDMEMAGAAGNDPVVVRDGLLLVASLGVIGVAGAALWQPTPVARGSESDLLAGLARLTAAADGFDGDRGLGWRLTDRPPSEGPEALLLEHAAPAIDALTAWLETSLAWPDGPEPPERAAEIIGLGPGLTPSGDDWLGGAMVALHGLGRGDVARRLSAWALPLAQQRTGKISIAHLAAAAGGQGAAALHDAIAAIAGADGAPIDSALARLDAIGHSSGWDALAGAVAVIGILAAG